VEGAQALRLTWHDDLASCLCKYSDQPEKSHEWERQLCKNCELKETESFYCVLNVLVIQQSDLKSQSLRAGM
jgi:hypothetical protein